MFKVNSSLKELRIKNSLLQESVTFGNKTLASVNVMINGTNSSLEK